MRTASSLLVLGVSLAPSLAAAGCQQAPTPYGALHVTVDTDVAVPRLVSNLRLDVWRDGTWIDAREVPLRDARFLPASFAVYSSAGQGQSDALIRLRAYGDGALVDAPPAPRLVQDGKDVTPSREPDPALAIDALFRVTLAAGDDQHAHVVLRGACAGVAADVATGLTCDASSAARVDAPMASGLAQGGEDGAASLAGTFGVDASGLPAPRGPSGDDDGGESLVPGGAFVLGSRDLSANRSWGGIDVSSIPPRVVVVSSFLMDRYEVSVGRFRRALARGFVPPAMPNVNDAPFPATLSDAASTDGFCTFSTTPRAGPSGPMGSREAMPLSCVTFATARAFCVFEGGDLPTETEWEYAASAALRPAKTAYAFGDDEPTCAGAVFARTTLADEESSECVRLGLAAGPGLVGRSAQDVTPSAPKAGAGGLHDLGGNVAEWTRDRYGTYDDACWSSAPRTDPACDGTRDERHVTRGGAFTEPRAGMVSALRKPAAPALPFSGIGLRCVRRKAAP